MPAEESVDTIAKSPPVAPKSQTKRGTEHLWHSFWQDQANEYRNELVEAYQPLVRRVVARFAVRLPRTVDRGDLDTAGSVGLMKAIASYDPGRCVRFEAYAERRIRGAMLDELRKGDWLPRPWRQRIEKQKRIREQLRAVLGREPYDEEVAEGMGLRFDAYESFFGHGLPSAASSATALGFDDEDVMSALAGVPDTSVDPPTEQLTRTELLRLVAQRMTEQEYRVIYLKYWEDLPMREIGLLTNLSESRVCKIHSSLLDRLKDRFQVAVEG